MIEILQLVATWMDLKGIVLSAISLTEEDKYYLNPLMCSISNKQAKSAAHRIGGWIGSVEGQEVVEMGEGVKRLNEHQDLESSWGAGIMSRRGKNKKNFIAVNVKS